jgi:hypothetical protein
VSCIFIDKYNCPPRQYRELAERYTLLSKEATIEVLVSLVEELCENSIRFLQILTIRCRKNKTHQNQKVKLLLLGFLDSFKCHLMTNVA